MSPPGSGDAQLSQHAFELLSIHETMLGDEPRNRAFQRALEIHVKQGSKVLDIGSGSGVWAIMAAKLGAAKVVAIERDGLMCGIIRRLALENGVSDRVTVVEGWSSQVSLADERFDIVISETVGHMIFDEDVVGIMMDARERFLAPGGVLIPERLALVAAPVKLKQRSENLPAGLTLDFKSLQNLMLHRPLAILGTEAFECLAPEQELVASEMTTVVARPDVSNLTASWDLKDSSAMDGVAVWMTMVLTQGVTLTGPESAHWSSTLYRFAPFKEAAGEFRFALTLEPTTNTWTAVMGGHVQKLSPSIAATHLLLQSQASPAMLPHLMMGSESSPPRP